MKTTIDSQQLRVFLALAHCSNLSRAAAELGLTPSAISHGLKALEADLGCRLVDRDSRRMTLTEAGTLFLAEAEQILDRMKNARGRLEARSTGRGGELRIGAAGVVGEFLFPAVLREFRESFPEHTLTLRACPPTPSAANLRTEEFHLIITAEPTPGPGLEFTALGADDLLFCTHPLHPWAVQRQVLRDDLAQRKVITPERGSATFQLLQSYFREEQVRLLPFLEVNDERAALELVRRDLGIGILPRWLAQPHLRARHLAGFPLGRRRLKRRWGVLHSRSRALNLAETLFVSLCRSAFQDLVLPEDVSG